MAISGFLFLSWRIFELVITVPIVGMLAWFVHQYVKVNQLTPNYILILFIVSVLALAWIVFTLIAYLRARHDAIFVALIDLGFVGAFIGGVVVMRFIAGQDCGNLNAGVTTSGSYFNWGVNKTCAMLKASFALGIIDIIAFFVTFILALLVHRHHKNDDRTTVKREYRSSGSHNRRRSGSRDYRGSRDYNRPRSSGRSHHSSSRRHNNYYV
ncbi:uncharacterized protein LTR77_011036 [Saxophila tyrrhenica]|uniref:MARVEL domain-containing protein n=1 Tax=Saxophila tyrrhenica TaxID=1690608 RepID=A0AAV9NXS3_9PEZI|nr:hypothetical protein LTR77_011036 [Saxophila tyrrhenica]